MRRAIRLAVTVTLAMAVAAGAGSAGAGSRLTVFAAASLTNVFPKIDSAPRYSFGGSNQLATQIRQGAPADVFAAAAPSFTQELYRQGLVDKPVTFVYNRLILIVPRSNPAEIDSVYDLRRSGIKLVVANPTVPVGAYTRTVLRNLGLTSVLSNVVSQESDVKGVVGKVALGEADAGFVYVTDARAAADDVTGIQIPTRAQPTVRYEVAVVSRSKNKAAAARFIAKLLGKTGRAKLAEAGFILPKAK